MTDKPTPSAMKAAEMVLVRYEHSVVRSGLISGGAQVVTSPVSDTLIIDLAHIIDTATNLSAKEEALRELVALIKEYIAVDGGRGLYDSKRLLDVQDALPTALAAAEKALE